MTNSKGFLLLLAVLITSASASEWVDSRTPVDARVVQGMGDRQLHLVFSDEFEDEKRSFVDGHDTRWTAEDRPGIPNAAIQYYNSSFVKTRDGKLVIETARQNATWKEYDPKTGEEYSFSRVYSSGMVTTWNKFCFTSGMIEISFKLPGKALRGGLWPAFWMLGNLARPSYMESTDGIWPWSYDQCGTSAEALEADAAQRISNCQEGKGRGSPEIDIIEAQPGDFTLEYEKVTFVDKTTRQYSLNRPLISSSLQVSPGVASYLRPFTPNMPLKGEWYPDLYPMGGRAYVGEGINNLTTSNPRMINNYWYGQIINEVPEIWQDGLSANWNHDERFYEEHHNIIRTEWQTGSDDGFVRFYDGDKLIYDITADMLRKRPGSADALPVIPFEAMYLILNTDVSTRWGWNGCRPDDPCLSAYGLCSPEGQLTCLDCGDPHCLRCPDTTGWLADLCKDIDPRRPAKYEIDYIRVYQDKSDPLHTLGCDPPEYPTKQYIQDHWEKYTFNSYIKKESLLVVQHGGGECSTKSDCGNFFSVDPSHDDGTEFNLKESVEVRGPIRASSCVNGKCKCPTDWTGPFCQSPCVGDLANCEPATNSRAFARLSGHVLLMISTGIGFLFVSFF